MLIQVLVALIATAPSLARTEKEPLRPYRGACFINRGDKDGVANVELKQGEERSLLKENGYEFKVAYDEHGLWLSDEGTPTVRLTILKDGKELVESSAPLSNRILRPIYLGYPPADLRFYCKSVEQTMWVCEDDGITRDGPAPKK